MRGLDKFLLISGALVIVTSLTVRHLLPDEDAQQFASLKSVFPQAERFLPQNTPLPHHQAIARDWQTGDTRLLGYCFDTAEIAPRVRGFGGPMHIEVGVDLSGRLVGLEILDHNETPAYVVGLEEPWFLNQFVGKGMWDPLEMGQDLDALSVRFRSSSKRSFPCGCVPQRVCIEGPLTCGNCSCGSFSAWSSSAGIRSCCDMSPLPWPSGSGAPL